MPSRPLAALALSAALASPALADTQESELSFSRFAHEQGPDHPLYCMYGYFASKTGDHAAATHIFERCVAEADNPAAMIYLSMFYEEGLGVEANPAKARALIRQAAEDGYSVAQYHLGEALLAEAEDEAGREEALRWLTLAAEQGDDAAKRTLARVERGS